MKKIVLLLLVTALFMACSKEYVTEEAPFNDKIIGIWEADSNDYFVRFEFRVNRTASMLKTINNKDVVSRDYFYYSFVNENKIQCKVGDPLSQVFTVEFFDTTNSMKIDEYLVYKVN